MILHRRVANIFVPPVDYLEDEEALTQMFAIHVERKLLFNDLVEGGVDFETVLEACEAYIGTSQMDGFIAEVEPQLDLIVGGDD